MMCHMVLYTYVKNETRAIWRKFKKHNFANLNLLSSEVKNFSRKPPCEFWDLMAYYLHVKNHENPLTLPNIRGDRQNPPPLIRISSVTSCQKCFRWHIFLLFISIYWRILEKFHDCIISTFEIMNVFWRAVLTKWWLYGQNTVQMTNTWNRCKMWTT